MTAFSSKSRRNPWLRGIFLLFLFTTLGGLLFLGSWQVQRLQWKRALIERVDTRVHAPEQPPPTFNQWRSSPNLAEDFEYLHVKLEGYFLHDKEIPVYASTIYGPGYWIMTPFQTRSNDEHAIVWVNRGYVPNSLRLPQSRPNTLNEGSVTLTGLLRLSEQARLLQRSNVIDENRWYLRSIHEFNAAKGFAKTAPFFIDAAKNSAISEQYPIAGLTVIHFKNNHLSYAITWFGLALLNIWAITLVARGERRGDKKMQGHAHDKK